jgi:hypothetical protein
MVSWCSRITESARRNRIERTPSGVAAWLSTRSRAGTKRSSPLPYRHQPTADRHADSSKVIAPRFTIEHPLRRPSSSNSPEAGASC